ncbi:MAG: copper amine oxidase N-terminal domain-containing protein [Firmicutes bacterium]|nr:copper amine oxidase N-terminal domain-containing protein [Bacillota bacterium]
MKKAGMIFITLVIMLFSAVYAAAADGVIRNGRTFVPVRGVFEQLGFSVDWNAAAEKASLSDGKHNISIIKGANYFKIDGKQIYPDVSQQVINNSLYLPVKAIADAVGAETSWNAEKKLVHISYNGKDAYITCAEEKTVPVPAKQTTVKQTQQSSSSAAVVSKTYILNTNTMKIHSPDCSSVSQIKPVNKQEYTGTIEELYSRGFTVCGKCLAQ